MREKIFAVSDVHGHYTALMKALRLAGFDEKNEAHVFLSCGDLFDRGRENARVYQFVKNLPRKILIRGNHEDMLRQILERGTITETDKSNGTDVTVTELLGENSLDASGNLSKRTCPTAVLALASFLDSMQSFYERGRYVFTHGWLPIVFRGRYPEVDPNYREASKEAWEEARLLEWQQLYAVGAMLNDKTIVCGHRPAYLGYLFDGSREPDCCEPFYGDGMIAIDAGVVRSGCIHVLVIEEI